MLVLVAYAPALSGGWVWDDADWIARSEVLREPGGLARIWLEPGATIQYYPLTHTSWWLDARLWDLDPRALHVENALLHGIAAVLLLALLRHLRLPGALLGAALFALHPVQVESVAWLTERKNALCAPLYLASLLAFLRARDGGSARAWAASFALFALALAAKTAAVVLPAVALALEWGRGRRIDRGLLARLAPFAALALAAGLLTVRMERGEGAVGPEWDLAPLQRLELAGRATWFYLGSLLWPVDLAFAYPRWELRGTWASALPPALALALVAAVLAAARRRLGRAPLAALAAYVAALAPVLGALDFYYMRYAFVADHFQYLASPAPLALAAAGLAVGASRLGAARAATVAAALLVGALGLATWSRAGDFRDEETLWRASLRERPGAWLPHAGLGHLLAERGAPDDGLEHHLRALELHPRAFESLVAVANRRTRDGRFDEARALYERALAVRPHDALTYDNLGVLESARGRTAEAISWWEAGLGVAPGHPDLTRNLALALAASRDPTLRDAPRALELAERLADRPRASAHDLYALFTACWSAGQHERARAVGGRALALAESEGAAELAAQLRAMLERLGEE